MIGYGQPLSNNTMLSQTSVGYVGRSVGYVGRSVDYVGRSMDYVGRSVDYVGRIMDYVGRSVDYVGKDVDYVGNKCVLKKVCVCKMWVISVIFGLYGKNVG